MQPTTMNRKIASPVSIALRAHSAAYGNRFAFLSLVSVLLVGSMLLVYIGFVKVKMLPFDNKNEFQVVIDMPEGVSLEETARATRALADTVLLQENVVNVQTYVGTASPYNFNGLVRHYYLRRGSNVADIQVNLLPKHERSIQSHEIAKSVRTALLPVAEKFSANIKVAEVPPGPPVLQTLVAEVYGPTAEGRETVARQIRQFFEEAPGVVDVDWYIEDDAPRIQLLPDSQKAALHGISEADIARTISMASAGHSVGLLHDAKESEDVPIRLRLDRGTRSDIERLLSLRIPVHSGGAVPSGSSRGARPRRQSTSQEPDAVTAIGRWAGRWRALPTRSSASRRSVDAHRARRRQGNPAHGGAAVQRRSLFSEVGRRMAHHLRGLPRYGPRLRRGSAADLHSGCGLVPELPHAARDHGRHPVFSGGHSAGARHDGRVLHGDLDDRLHRGRGHCRPQLDHPRGFHGAAACRRA